MAYDREILRALRNEEMPYPPRMPMPRAIIARRRIAEGVPSNWRMARKPEKTKAMAISMNTKPRSSCHKVRAGFKTAGTTKPRKRRLCW